MYNDNFIQIIGENAVCEVNILFKALTVPLSSIDKTKPFQFINLIIL